MITPGLAVRLAGAQRGSDAGESWPRAIEALRALGVGAVEIGSTLAGELARNVAECDRLCGALADGGVRVAGVEGYGSVDEDVDIAVRLGAPLSRGTPKRTECLTATTERELVARMADAWRGAIEAARARSVRVFWELDDADARVTPSVIEQVLRAVDDPSFGIVFDTGKVESLAERTGHEVVEDGKRLTGALGLLERFKGWIGAVRIDAPHLAADARPLDWSRLLPALVDAWIPARWWTIGEYGDGVSIAREAAEFFRARILPLYPETIGSAPGGATSGVTLRSTT